MTRYKIFSYKMYAKIRAMISASNMVDTSCLVCNTCHKVDKSFDNQGFYSYVNLDSIVICVVIFSDLYSYCLSGQ